MGLIEIAIFLGVLGALGFLLLEMHRRSLRTRIFQIPGGLRFEAQDFSVQILRKEQEVQVRCGHGVFTPAVADAVQEPSAAEPLGHTFAALGFSVNVREQSTPQGHFDIVMRDANGAQLAIQRVNATVAASFELFYLQVHQWIEKLEQRAKRERVKRLRSEEEVAEAKQIEDLMTQLAEDKSADGPISQEQRNALAATQIAQWRNAAGFEGQHTLQHIDDKGLVAWFVDLTADGRITLHANKRTIHTTLRGASIVSKNGELEIGVRDAYWTEEDPELRTFPVLKGLSADERRAWKERLELLRGQMAIEKNH
jgi:hypothetical protein